MSERNSKVVGISLPPEVYKKLDILMKTKYMNRSELVRDMIDVYTNTISHVNKITTSTTEPLNLDEKDLARVLKAYYEIRTNQNVETIIVGLGMIIKDGKVLIGKRAKADANIKNLTWVFPGGKLETLNFALELTNRIKTETGLDVKTGKLIHTRIHPDNLNSKLNIVALYFHCEVDGGTEKPGGRKSGVPLTQLKWVDPADIMKYFTGSMADEVMRFLMGVKLASS